MRSRTIGAPLIRSLFVARAYELRSIFQGKMTLIRLIRLIRTSDDKMKKCL